MATEEILVTPPPPWLAELPVKVQLVSVGEEELLFIPPPWPPEEADELPLKVHPVSKGEDEVMLYIPPPPSVAELPVNVQLVMDGEEE